MELATPFVDEVEIERLRDQEIVQELKLFLKITSNWMAIPLFLLFWIADFIYVPHLKFEFLILRLSIIPLCLFFQKQSIPMHSPRSIQILAGSYSVALASIINIMIFLIGDSGTYYYAGLNLVAIGCLSFLPLRHRYFLTAALGIYLPYFIMAGLFVNDQTDIETVVVNGFFIVGTLVMSLLIRFFHENLRKKELQTRMMLKSNIRERDGVIAEKTKEAVRLNTLSSQFSPQVVRAIAEGHVDIESGVHRSKICAIFIDIVNSTERVVRLDQAKIDQVLSRFMDTTVGTLLKYDLTIDKFQGDGILAFANDPIRRADFVQRTCLAALEILDLLKSDRSFYIMTWKKEMQVRIGISVGYANVGFYGNKKFFKTYTAIGAPLPLASRLTNLAEPNQILVDSDVAEVLMASGYTLKNLGVKKIKGFEDDENFVFELVSSAIANEIKNLPSEQCPNHPESVLVLDINDLGHYVMKCRLCEYEQGSMKSASSVEAAA